MNFEQYVQDANKFLKTVSTELGNPEDTDHAYRVTRAFFQTLREIITPEESLDLVSQLPMFLKAMYVEGWKLGPKARIRSTEEFLERLRSKTDRTAARDFGNNETAKEKVTAVIKALKQYVSPGEIQDIIDQFPMEFADIWITQTKEKV